jgi:short subunit dehydrogenase-like uncharacterized protein
MQTFFPTFSGGPTVEAMNSGWFRALFVAVAEDGTRVWAQMADRGDPANRVTCKIVAEAALALAMDREDLPGGAGRAGVLTPATALGNTLVNRLCAAGMTITCPAVPA